MSDDRGTNRSAEAYIVSMAPDVCKTPMGTAMVPVPYTITCKFDVAQATATRTRFGGQPVFTMGSYLPTVQGDEPGVGGGIISGVNLGACRPVEHSKSVRVENQGLVRHGDLMAMNCAGPKGTGNTYGKIVYIGVTPGASIGPNGEIVWHPQESTSDSQLGETATDLGEPAATEAPYDPTTDPEYQEALEEQERVAEEIAAAEREIAREAIKAGVDVAGLLDPTPTSDLISAGMSIDEGDYWGAGLSFISVIPYLGDAIAKPIKAARMARKATKLAGKLKKLKAKAAKLTEKLGDLKKGKKPKPGKGASGGKGPDGGHIPKKKTAKKKVSKSKHEEWKNDPQTGKPNPKSVSEADSMKKAIEDGHYADARRPDLSQGEPNLDFKVTRNDGTEGWLDVKTPVDPNVRNVSRQAADISKKIKSYDGNVDVLVDLKNLPEGVRGQFKSELIDLVDPSKIGNVIFQ